jgi:hypothetical protein
MARSTDPQYVFGKDGTIRVRANYLSKDQHRAQARWLRREEARCREYLDWLKQTVDGMRAAGATAEEIAAFQARAEAECTLDQGVLTAVSMNQISKDAPLDP